MARIVQAANFYGPTSGGLRTTIDALGRGYTLAGHGRVLVVPGPADADERDAAGRRITIRGRRLPGGGGHYHFLPSSGPAESVLRELAPDRLEVSDKLTLHRLGGWAGAAGVPSVLLSHERIDAILARRVPPGFPLRSVANWRNRYLVQHFDTIVCASAFAAAEYELIDAPNVVRVPLGVDLDRFHPTASGWDHATVRLVCAGRLSREKFPALAIETLRRLVAEGVPARLVMVGDGPERRTLTNRASSLPVEFTGALDQRELAAEFGRADVALAPCPYETFGLAALEALASGTPIITANRGALPELLLGAGPAGLSAPLNPVAFAGAVRAVLSWPVAARRAAARQRAEWFPWSRTIAELLHAHALPASSRAPTQEVAA